LRIDSAGNGGAVFRGCGARSLSQPRSICNMSIRKSVRTPVRTPVYPERGVGLAGALCLAAASAAGLSACNGSPGHTAAAVAGSPEGRVRTLALPSDSDTAAELITVGTGPKTKTAGVLCDYAAREYNNDESVMLTAAFRWSCTTTSRLLRGNGVPNHEVGTFPNPANPNTISKQAVTAEYTLKPAIVSTTGTPVTIVGYGLNSVKFDPGTAGTCDDSGTDCSLIGGTGTWRIEALGQESFDFGEDTNNAHVQPTGEYHYHGMPEALITKLGGDSEMRLVGWASDGFPIYARKGYKQKWDAGSGLTTLQGSYRTKATPDANRPPISLYPMGTFQQDWEYVAGLGDLDECNGRKGVTPEFPNGTYHYMITDSYPYIQRCVKGTPADGGPPPPPAMVS
jgi:YHYH protein